MTLKEIVTENPSLQYVLSFSNNNHIFLHSEDFDVNSKFMRRSKVRLGVDFSLVGFVHDNGILDSTPDEECSMIYKTNRPDAKNDYVLYVNPNPEVLVNHVKSVKHSRVAEYRQQTINSITEPDKDRVLHIYPGLESITFKGNVLSMDYTSHIQVSSSRYYGMWESIIIGLKTASKYRDRFSEVNIHLDKNEYTRQIVDYIYGKKTNNRRNILYLSALREYNNLNVKFYI